MATVLIVVGCLLAPLSVLAVWAANQVSDTGRYVANVEPLIHDLAIQNALTDKITNEVKARTGYRIINDFKIVLPILTLLLLALGVYVARGHRRALIGAGLGLAGSMALLGAGLLIFRSVYLNSVPNSVLPADAAAAMFDTLVRFIKQGLRAILVLGLVVAAGAFVTGPSVTAVRIRGAFASGLA